MSDTEDKLIRISAIRMEIPVKDRAVMEGFSLTDDITFVHTF